MPIFMSALSEFDQKADAISRYLSRYFPQELGKPRGKPRDKPREASLQGWGLLLAIFQLRRQWVLLRIRGLGSSKVALHIVVVRRQLSMHQTVTNRFICEVDQHAKL